jgi:dihydrofolate reductase
MICGIVCVDSNWGIGKKNDLLFHLKKDMQFFKQQTSDSIVFCGYNTLLSFPGSKPLKGRSTICLCPEGVERDDCFCVHDFDQAVKLIKELAKTTVVWVIGGAMLYKSMLPYYDRVYVNKVYADGEAEVFFPNLDDYAGMKLTKAFSGVDDEDYLTQLHLYTKNEELAD